MRTEVRVVNRGIEALSRARREVWRRWGRRVRDYLVLACTCIHKCYQWKRTELTPVDDSSSGRLRTCSVICMSVRGMLRVRMLLRRVLCRRVSRCRSFGPGDGLAVALRIWRQGAKLTADSEGRPNIDFYRRFLWHFISSLDLNWPIHGADDRVPVVCVCC
jgi:hypothetical protein